MSDLVGNHVVGFPMRWLIYLTSTYGEAMSSAEGCCKIDPASNHSIPYCHMLCDVASICAVRIKDI